MSLSYVDWKNEYKSVLETFSEKNVLMFFTGGKDSSTILSFLVSAGKEFGFEFETDTARYPNFVFTDSEIKKLDNYWRSRNVNIQWHDLDTSDLLLSKAEKQGKNPCYVCQKIKRNPLFNNLMTMEQYKDIVIILSFTLWDLVSYSIEYLVEGVYCNNNSKESLNDKSTEQRFIETSQRFYPLIELKDGLTVFKPLLKYNDNEIKKLVYEEKIPLSNVECPYKKYTPKRILFDYYEQINASFDYDKVLEYVKNSLKFRELSYYTEMGMEDFIKLL